MSPDFAKLREQFIKEAKKEIKNSLKEDYLIIQAISNISEIDKAVNLLVKRLREWYELYNPEFSKSARDHERFVETIISTDRKTLLKKLDLTEAQSMGSDLSQENIEPIMNLAKAIKDIYKIKESQERYLEKLMKKVMPNTLEVAGAAIGGKLLARAGSLERLSKITASTIQLLGAEKALFRHIKTGARCPKYGLIHEHPMVLEAKQPKRGKIARLLADKISIAAKVDFFGGKFIGDKLKKEVEIKAK